MMTGGMEQSSFDYAALDMETRIVVQQRTSGLREKMLRHQELVRLTAETTWLVGEDLANIQTQLRGSFLDWLAAEFPQWSQRTAYRFINVYRAFTFANLASMEIGTSALYLLAAPSIPESARQEAIELAASGEEITFATSRAIVAYHKSTSTPPSEAGIGNGNIRPVPEENGTASKLDEDEVADYEVCFDPLAQQALCVFCQTLHGDWQHEGDGLWRCLHCWEFTHDDDMQVTQEEVDGDDGECYDEEDEEIIDDGLLPECDLDTVGNAITAAPVHRLAPMFSSESDKHNTPKDIIARVLRVFPDGITLDPCSNSRENPNVPAKHVFTEEDDGLAHSWDVRTCPDEPVFVYMNPPYGDRINDWIARLLQALHDKEINSAIALLPARTDTDWCAPLFDFRICFIHGRLKFGAAENSAPFPSMLVYLGDDIQAFIDAFRDIGRIMRHCDDASCGKV
jgi:hypothetical protein